MKIRKATSSDADAIAEIHISTWRAAYRGQVPDDFLDSLDVSQRIGFWHGVLSAEHGVFVAVSETTVIGFCSFIASRDEDAVPGEVAEIATLYVSSRHWRCGVGRSLCDHVLEAAAAAGFSVITLWVLASNNPAIAFYAAAGFVGDGATKSETNSSGFTIEELRMRRILPVMNDRNA